MKALYAALAFFPLFWTVLAIGSYAQNDKKPDYPGVTVATLMLCFIIWSLIFFLGHAFA